MLNGKQISFLDHPELIGTARYGAPISPAELAERFHTIPERSFDDLGFYEFFGVECEVGILGFRMHMRPEYRISYVSFVAKDKKIDALEAISRLCDLHQKDISEFEEKW